MPRLESWLTVGPLLLAACGSNPTDSPPPPPAGIRVVSGAVADTIDAQIAAPVVVEVRRAGGDLATGASVVFNAVSPSGFVYLFVSPNASLQPLGVADTVPTDGQGRAQVWIVLNRVAQAAQLRIAVPSLGFLDSVAVTIRPGAGARITFAPADTALLVGGTYSLAATTRDRAGNPTGGPVTFAADSGPVSVGPAGSVTGNGIGRGVIRATTGAAVERARVSVVPTATFVAFEHDGSSPSGQGSRLVTFRSDGAQFKALATVSGDWGSGPPQFGAWPAWLPGTTEVVFIGDQALRAIDGNGAIRTIFSGDPPVFQYFPPRPSADGQWIYFTRGRWGFSASLWKVRPDGSEPTAVEDPGTFLGFQGGPAIDPSASHLVYQTGPWFGAELRNFDLTLRQSVSLGVRGSWADWSPDGTRIVFMDDDAAIRTIQPDGNGNRVIIDRSWVNPGFSWSPDGKYLVAMESHEPFPTPVIIDLTTLERLPLPYSIHGAKVLFHLAWKP